MKSNTLIRLFIFASLVVLFFQPPSYAGPSQQQNPPKSGTSPVPASPETKATSTSSPAPAPVKKQEDKRSKKNVYREQSVLERFRDFNGEISPTAFISLFEQVQRVGFRQDPPVALSDGKSIVRLIFVSTPERENISDVALSGARVVAAMKDPEATNTWIIAVLPEKGTDEVTMAVQQRGVLMVFTATVAPQVNIDLNRSGGVTEEDFRIFLNEQGTSSAPAYDLNGDGIRDFRDDYLFTANYLTLNPARGPAPTTLAPLAPVEPDGEEEETETEEPGEPLPPEGEPEGNETLSE